ncbi:hypothetical protein GLAREA_02359 [Glarea lozoyensis ATCC 20868]|uniref:Uncharacterized protein n=1 Tax=Glarea lozoyensis (strain ATCC 20868 / MF5171) TaxID=1116229 RepID=S3D313_GLAL2|nr:uncharacterized protein GLAREA_02359 [Glarea lozoyensis ATCC 20868]EPE26446.1 hypothetical protein GLAREA_02359 [Glarea lozoyensis ATCC 20868]
MPYSKIPVLLSRIDQDINPNRVVEHYIDRWHQIVSNYSGRFLTKEEDKLVALSGLAKVYTPLLGDEYIAGIWRSRIFTELLWHAETESFPETERPLRYRAPSWSWASIDAHITCHHALSPSDLRGQTCCTVLEAQVETLGHDTTGQVKGGFLRVSGVLRPCHFWTQPKDLRPQVLLDTTDHIAEIVLTDFFPIILEAMFDHPSEIDDSIQLYCLPVLHSVRSNFRGMVVRAGSTPETFERVGMFYTSISEDDGLETFAKFVIVMFEIPESFLDHPDPYERWRRLVAEEYQKTGYVRQSPELIEGLKRMECREIVIV